MSKPELFRYIKCPICVQPVRVYPYNDELNEAVCYICDSTITLAKGKDKTPSTK